MPRQGEEFHRLVEILERAVVDHPNITVESPKYLTDKVTEELREHDIVLTQRSPQRTTITAIECRDRSRLVTVNQLEEFHAKCEHTGVDKRVIVSRLGFYKTALKKAAHYGIDCLTFSQVDSVDWVSQTNVTIRERNLVHADMQISVASIASTARSCKSDSTCADVSCAMLVFACPSRSLTALAGVPAASKFVACVCHGPRHHSWTKLRDRGRFAVSRRPAAPDRLVLWAVARSLQSTAHGCQRFGRRAAGGRVSHRSGHARQSDRSDAGTSRVNAGASAPTPPMDAASTSACKSVAWSVRARRGFRLSPCSWLAIAMAESSTSTPRPCST
jgi:hypothetical protein